MTLENNGYIYLIQLREFIKCNESVYKICKTQQLDSKILKKYPSGSKLFIQIICNDCHKSEKKLIETFKDNFLQRTDYGREYFEGDVDTMIDTIYYMVRNIDDIIEFEKQMENEYKIKRKQQNDFKKKKQQIKETHKLLKTLEKKRVIIEHNFVILKVFMRTIKVDSMGKLNINHVYNFFNLFNNKLKKPGTQHNPEEFKKIMEMTYGVSSDNNIIGYSFDLYEEVYADFMEFIKEDPIGKLNIIHAYKKFKLYWREGGGYRSSIGTNKLPSNEEFNKKMEKTYGVSIDNHISGISFNFDNHISSISNDNHISGISFNENHINFSPQHPENKNIRIEDKNDKLIQIWKDNKWIYKNRNKLIDNIICAKYAILGDILAEMETNNEISELKLELLENIKDKYIDDDLFFEQIQKNIEIVILNNSDL